MTLAPSMTMTHASPGTVITAPRLIRLKSQSLTQGLSCSRLLRPALQVEMRGGFKIEMQHLPTE
jgi:hypothetical protein